MYVCVIYVCVYVCICVYVYICVCVYVYMFVCMHACMCVGVYMQCNVLPCVCVHALAIYDATYRRGVASSSPTTSSAKETRSRRC